MSDLNLVVFGYDELLLASLEFFSRTSSRIAAVVFPSTRRDAQAAEIRQIVADRGFTILEQPPRYKISGFAAELRSIKPDLIYAWSYPLILPEEIIEIPKFGCINVHMGLLPEYRGVNGVRWALLNGEEKTGITIHYMDSGIDTGDVISRVSFPITEQDDILSLMKKSRSAGLYLLENTWPQIASGNVKAVPQDESKAGYYSARMSSVKTVDWSRSNIEIHNFIRASVFPFPGAHTFLNEYKLVLRKSLPIKNTGQPATSAGIVKKLDSGGVLVTTGNGNLLITEIEFEGKAIPIEKLSDFGIEAGKEFRSS